MALVAKPGGPTSHDVVDQVRRALGLRRVGHLGTLDPFAAGLLVIVVGRATRLAQYAADWTKSYEGVIRLGRTTATDDATGPTAGASDAWQSLDRAHVEAALARFHGAYEQRPPAYSAVKVEGERAYRRARRGEPVALAARPVLVSALELVRFAPPDVAFRATVSGGTYVRGLARDVGEELGCGAHLATLVRTRVGPFRLEDGVMPERLTAGDLRERMTGTVATVGTFDGVHRGHQAVLAEIVRRARARGLASLVVTFDPHPLEVVNPAAAPRLLTLPDEKRELVTALGLDRVELVPFTPALARLAPEQFVRDVLRAQYRMQELVLGYDHGFGRGRTGDLDLVRRLAKDDGFAVDVVDAVRDDGQPISSSLIRTAVAHGDLAAAERWLGRRYSATGVVERGAGRGRTIGIPTINLAPPDPRKLLPPDGVYAVWVRLPGDGEGGRAVRYGGMMNQGPRPTFGIAARALEIHLFDFAGELYGETVTVEWVRRLRDVQTFASREALVEQLGRDAVAARAILNR